MEFTYQGLVRYGFGFYNPNHAAAAIVLVLPFLWWARRVLACRRADAVGKTWKNYCATAAVTLGEFALYGGLVLTYSRSGALALAVAAGVWWFAARRYADRTARPWRRWRRTAATVTILALALATGAWGRMTDGGGRSRAAAAGRWTAARAGLALLGDNPQGVGAGNSGRVATLYYVADGRSFRTLVNSPLTFAAEHGVTAGGALLWLWIVAAGGLAGAVAQKKREGGGYAAAALAASLAGITVTGMLATCFDLNAVGDWLDGGENAAMPNTRLQTGLAAAGAMLLASAAGWGLWHCRRRAALAAGGLAVAALLTAGMLFAGRYWAEDCPGARVEHIGDAVWAIAPLRENNVNAWTFANEAALPSGALWLPDGENSGTEQDSVRWLQARFRFHALCVNGGNFGGVPEAAARLRAVCGGLPAVVVGGRSAAQAGMVAAELPLVLFRPAVPPAAVRESLAAQGTDAGRVAAVFLSAWDPDGDNALWQDAFPGKVRLEE